ncbi:MAG: DNA polymerase III subunit delta [Gammaproteobacteria bacterium]|nr:MAG: DNA polymerase III subunit delta [Gammaproteobacteria bacterium]
MEMTDIIYATAKKQGFCDKEIIDIDGNFNWNSLQGKFSSLSLFSPKRFFVLKLPSAKPGIKGANFLKKYLSNPLKDVLILIISGKLEFSLYSKKIPKWYQLLQQNAKCYDYHPIKMHLMPQWITHRFAKLNQTIDKGAAIILSEHTQGNLISCATEITKINLSIDKKNITTEDVLSGISDNNKFNIFAMVDAIIEGKKDQAIKILWTLQEDGVAEPIINWAITNEIKKLTGLSSLITGRKDVTNFCRVNNIFPSKQAMYKNLSQQHSYKFWLILTCKVAILDRILKGKKYGFDYYQELTNVIMLLAKK